MISKLRNARLKENLNLEEAANKCGITPQYLSELERGIKTNPRVKTLEKIVKMYGDKNILKDFIKVN